MQKIFFGVVLMGLGLVGFHESLADGFGTETTFFQKLQTNHLRPLQATRFPRPKSLEFGTFPLHANPTNSLPSTFRLVEDVGVSCVTEPCPESLYEVYFQLKSIAPVTLHRRVYTATEIVTSGPRELLPPVRTLSVIEEDEGLDRRNWYVIIGQPHGAGFSVYNAVATPPQQQPHRQ